MNAFNVVDFNVQEFDRILACGLSSGLGHRGQQVCIEAAICQTLGLPHGDDPGCVASSVREFKIRLNDSKWSSPKARAEGLRDLGLAQLGSLEVVKDEDFTRIMAEKTIRAILPTIFREVFPNNQECLSAADRCEQEGTKDAAYAAYASAAAYAAYAYAAYASAAYASAAYASAANAASAASAAAYAAYAAYASAANAANAASAAANPDKYLLRSAALALETLRELKSPGCVLLKAA